MTAKIFIDGEVGTTGLQIKQRLEGRDDLETLSLPEETRKDPAARAEMLNSADLSILCLPEDASRQAVSLIDNPQARVIDASIAYRTDPDWVFGMAELNPGQRDRIRDAKRVSNPGCYACGGISLLHPLVDAGLLPADYPVTLNAVSGYSGGGKKLIDSFENPASEARTDSNFYLYGLGLEHKHTPEIEFHSGLAHRPLFVPSVGRFAQGMIVSLPLQLWSLPGKPSPADLQNVYAAFYDGGPFVTVSAASAADAMANLDPEALNGTNQLAIHVFGNAQRGQAVVCAVLDNLGKGASGQAVQNMNLMLGFEETAGLT